MLISQQFARRIRLWERMDPLAEPSHMPPLTVYEQHRRALMAGGLSYVLELNDKTAAAWALDARHPFMDKRLIEFCLALPPQQKLRAGWSRHILRNAMKGVLPEAVRTRRSKANLEPNFVHTLLKFERSRMDALILPERSDAEIFLNWRVVQSAYGRLCTNTYRSQDIATVWKAVTLMLWLRNTGLAPV
jgi:asparagine synthase (glutamine-hydrolysing)